MNSPIRSVLKKIAEALKGKHGASEGDWHRYSTFDSKSTLSTTENESFRCPVVLANRTEYKLGRERDVSLSVMQGGARINGVNLIWLVWVENKYFSRAGQESGHTR